MLKRSTHMQFFVLLQVDVVGEINPCSDTMLNIQGKCVYNTCTARKAHKHPAFLERIYNELMPMYIQRRRSPQPMIWAKWQIYANCWNCTWHKTAARAIARNFITYFSNRMYAYVYIQRWRSSLSRSVWTQRHGRCWKSVVWTTLVKSKDLHAQS